MRKRLVYASCRSVSFKCFVYASLSSVTLKRFVPVVRVLACAPHEIAAMPPVAKMHPRGLWKKNELQNPQRLRNPIRRIVNYI